MAGMDTENGWDGYCEAGLCENREPAARSITLAEHLKIACTTMIRFSPFLVVCTKLFRLARWVANAVPQKPSPENCVSWRRNT